MFERIYNLYKPFQMIHSWTFRDKLFKMTLSCDKKDLNLPLATFVPLLDSLKTSYFTWTLVVVVDVAHTLCHKCVHVKMMPCKTVYVFLSQVTPHQEGAELEFNKLAEWIECRTFM